MTARDWVRVEAVLALCLFLLWLAPWVDVPGSGTAYGYELPPALRDIDRLSDALSGSESSGFNPFLLIYVLPVCCIATLFQEAVRIDPTLVASCAGIVPVAALGYAFGILGMDLIPLLHPAAFIAIFFSAAIVAICAFAPVPQSETARRVRNYAALGVYLVAAPVAATIGYFHRPG